jgi:ABC-type antimicrobial peptide transport system permease subunit
VIRAKADSLSTASPVRNEFESLDAQLAPSKIRTLDQVIAESTARTNFNVLLLSVFAVVALSLAAVGIYGLMSYAVEQRTQEIGIRMALGADRSRILRLVLGQSMKLSAIGTALGLLAALGLTWFLGRLLFAVKPTDPLAYATVVVILAAVALFAAFVPARRATQVDPMLALRRE